MDSITHTVLGACTGELIAGKKLGKKAMLIGAIVNNLPDIDVVANFWNSPASSLLSHRGITHSILFAMLATPLLVYVFKKFIKNDTLDNKRWMLLVAHGLFLHILMDACTTYGTGWFEPFSHVRVSFNTLFILDPFFMFPLLVAAVTLLILKIKKNLTRKRIATVALIVSSGYLLATAMIKLRVNTTIEKELARQKISADSYMGSPTPMNNLLWYVLIKEKEDFRVGYYSVLDRSTEIGLTKVPKQDSLLQPYLNSEDVEKLKRFSKNYYCIHPAKVGILFSDMRFGLNGVQDLSSSSFVFNFDITKDRDSAVHVKQSEFKTATSEDLSRLFRRIKGI